MLTVKPMSLADANSFVAEHHRHHKPVRGHKFSLGCMANGRLAGVAIVGRPVSRYLDDGLTLEVNRLCTDGTKNACSFLYGAAARAATSRPLSVKFRLGFERPTSTAADTARRVREGGADALLLETCQDLLQIKAGLVAYDQVAGRASNSEKL